MAKFPLTDRFEGAKPEIVWSINSIFEVMYDINASIVMLGCRGGMVLFSIDMRKKHKSLIEVIKNISNVIALAKRAQGQDG